VSPREQPPRDVPLRAAYRLQLHGDFAFADAAAVVPYLERLGVSHAYLSPVLAARRGSTHGYDVTDPRRLNPELGGADGWRALGRAVRRRGLGVLLDVVPNHMAASHENPAWCDVLEHGRASPYARWFDIDWYAASDELRGRVLLPVLGARLGEVLERRELSLGVRDGRVEVRYFEHVFPVDPQTVPRVLGAGLDAARAAAAADGGFARLAELLARHAALPPRSVAGDGRSRRRDDAERLAGELAALARAEPTVAAHLAEAAAAFAAGEAGPARLRRFLDRQAYLLVYWRRAAREINYRRFFNINELVALRAEDPAVFEETHAQVLAWVRDGEVDGLRIDHVDGLRDPRGYLERLRAAVDERRGRPGARVPILVEKILSPGERLRAEWPVEGTTGYEVLNDLEALFVEPAGYAAIERRYRRLLRPEAPEVDFATVAREGKRLVLRGSLSADVGRLVKLLEPVARRDPRAAALPRARLLDAVVETIVALGVYRTYVDAGEERVGPRATDEDAAWVERAVAEARGRADDAALDLLREVLLLRGLDDLPPAERLARRRVASRFQQVSGPATAKGVEDTALYLYVPLVSRNEVGGEPDRDLAEADAAFHAGNAERAARWPRALVTASTHDTKRGADTRARLDVLSEVADDWWRLTERWRRANVGHRGRSGRRWAPDANTEYLLYQTMVGIWPVSDHGGAGAPPMPDAATLDELRGRLRAYMEKAVREGKSRSGWVDQDPAFEAALGAFIDALFDPARSAPFLAELGAFARRIARPGWWNGLSRTLLHLTIPGVPDLYQGTELWDFTLVDPDNRRPVNYPHRAKLLDELVAAHRSLSPERRRGLVRDLVARPEDGRVKLYLVHRLLQARLAHPALFAEGSYEPLAADGPAARHVVAFARRAPDGRSAAVAVASRWTVALTDGPAPTGPRAWGDTTLPVAPGGAWRCALTGRLLPSDGALPLAEALADAPVGLLISDEAANVTEG
jgi:(1->4)-alpha-D-glucan 1-alpha-D-glucosylmutase